MQKLLGPISTFISMVFWSKCAKFHTFMLIGKGSVNFLCYFLCIFYDLIYKSQKCKNRLAQYPLLFLWSFGVNMPNFVISS